MTINISQMDMSLVYLVFLLAAVFICFQGYRVYRLALALIGFAVGFSRTQPYLQMIGLEEGTALIVQILLGLLCALLSWYFMRIGIFIAVYHFAQDHLSAGLSALLAEKLDIPQILYPIFAAIAGIAIAWLIAWLAMKSERVVVILVTAVVGGFATISFLLELLPRLPIADSAILSLPAYVWLISQGILALAGSLVQFFMKE